MPVCCERRATPRSARKRFALRSLARLRKSRPTSTPENEQTRRPPTNRRPRCARVLRPAMTDAPITDADRYPTLSEHGRAMLTFMREHPHAPIYRNESGNRLRAEDVVRVRDAEREVLAAQIDWQPGQPPAWVSDFVRQCLDTVPHYRNYGLPSAE